MSNRLGVNAARALRERDETAQRNGSRRSRRTITAERDILDERGLAEFEALLMRDLKRSPSPSIAAEDDAGEQPLRDSAPMRKLAPRARPPHKLQHPSPTEFRRGPAPEPRLTRALDRLDDLPPLAAMPRANPRSRAARAMGIAATLFSLVALVAVSALLVLLAVGGEWTTSAVTGSTETKQDVSRIPAQEYTARVVGTVRAVHTQEAAPQNPQPAAALSAQNAPAAGAAIADQPSPGPFAAPSVFSPPAARQASAANRGFEPENSGAAPEAKDAAAPAPAAATESAATESAATKSAATKSAGNAAEPAAATRSAPVTTHVNLRAKPDNDAAVVAVVPAKRNVEVVECTQWCEVVYGGKQGFVHRRFVSGAGG
jgi:hypothetical protein